MNSCFKIYFLSTDENVVYKLTEQAFHLLSTVLCLKMVIGNIFIEAFALMLSMYRCMDHVVQLRSAAKVSSKKLWIAFYTCYFAI